MQSHDVAPSLYCTVISIDSPHMHKDGSNYLEFLLVIKDNFWQALHFEFFPKNLNRSVQSPSLHSGPKLHAVLPDSRNIQAGI